MIRNAIIPVLALAIGTAFSTAAEAKDVDLKGCTADGYTATLVAHINDDAIKLKPDLPQKLNDIFSAVARSLPAKDLLSDVGGQEFFRQALTYDVHFFRHVSFTTDPAITRGCSR